MNLVDVISDWYSLPDEIVDGVDVPFLKWMKANAQVSWEFASQDYRLLKGKVFTRDKPTHLPSISLASRGNQFSVATQCSCAVAAGCSHVNYLAAFVHDHIGGVRDFPGLMEKLQFAPVRADSAEAWLETISENDAPRQASSVKGNSKDVYTGRALLLRFESSGRSIASVTVMVNRAKKRGDGIVSKVVDRDNLDSLALVGGRSDEETQAIVSVLDAQQQRARRGEVEAARYRDTYNRYGSTRPLEETSFTHFEVRTLEAAIRVLMKNHALYVEDMSGHPALPSDVRHIGTSWTQGKDNKTWSMRFVSEPSGQRFDYLSVGALGVYISEAAPGAKVYGELKGDLALLGTEPPASIESRLIPAILNQLRRRHIEHAYGLDSFRLPRPLQVPAVPCVTYGALMHVSRGQNAAHTAGFIRLSFRYGEHFLEAGKTSVVIEAANGEDDDIEVIRDLAGERQALGLLESLGVTNGFPAKSTLKTNTTTIDPAEAKKLYLKDQGSEFSSPQSLYMSTVAALGHAGFEIILSDGLDVRLVDDPEISAVLEPEGDAGWWFDVSLGVMIDGKRMDAMSIVSALLKNPLFNIDRPIEEQARIMLYVPFSGSTVIKLSVAKVRAVIAPVLELLQHALARGEKLRVPRLVAGVIASEAEMRGTRWDAPESLRETLRKLTQVMEDREVPSSFNAKLRPYQVKGFHWLAWLSEIGLGGILADDMGLGKTIQVLAHVLSEWELMRHKGMPVLVVANKTLVDNWERETREKAPILRPLRYYGGVAERRQLAKRFAENDIVITTYETLIADSEVFMATKWSLLVADEAHKMKNPSTNWFKVIRELPAARRLCVTGTPVENRLLDLWSLMDVAEPGFLGNRAQFKEQFINPIEKENDDIRVQALKKRISPLILRRLKEEVASDLPPLQEKTIAIELSDAQRNLYESIRVLQHEKIKELIAEVGINRAHTHILSSLMRMRQVCLSPRLVDLEAAAGLSESAKLEVLMTLLRTLKEEGRKALVFSSFSKMLDLVGEQLRDEGFRYCKLTGQTSNRQAVVDLFQNEPKISVFLLSLKAGGVGLNLTAADTVIILDPWWNPAAEDQAGDRAHRIGQDKPVTLIRLICTNTVEQKVEKLKSRKRELVDALFGDGAGSDPRFEMEDIEELFGPSASLSLSASRPQAPRSATGMQVRPTAPPMLGSQSHGEVDGPG